MKTAVKLAPAFTDAQITAQIHMVNFHKAMIDMEQKRIADRQRDLAHAEVILSSMRATRIVPA